MLEFEIEIESVLIVKADLEKALVKAKRKALREKEAEKKKGNPKKNAVELREEYEAGVITLAEYEKRLLKIKEPVDTVLVKYIEKLEWFIGFIDRDIEITRSYNRKSEKGIEEL